MRIILKICILCKIKLVKNRNNYTNSIFIKINIMKTTQFSLKVLLLVYCI